MQLANVLLPRSWLWCLQDSTLPDTLAAVCNDIGFVGSDGTSTIVCQGFVYDRQQNVAFFKGQINGQLLDTKRLCSAPTTYAWLRNTGKSCVQSNADINRTHTNNNISIHIDRASKQYQEQQQHQHLFECLC